MYHDAFYKNDRAAVRKLLADEGLFQGPLSSFTDPDAFLDSASVFMKLGKHTPVKNIMMDGENVCLFYEATYKVPSIPTLPIAAWFKVENGKIKFFHVYFDPGAFIKAKENGDIAKALQA